ncbi:hypothetical protein CKM354_001141500 [Cercospora kikuchii]|uniref:Heterokaryon incompatibility domain-containing protein n=1 Tax=Cercospora kikuchii TaxID=84275 RepID=A0A9P3CWZ9_9PEZI|nr:uncharacterized protein CKM354_001141500 [Cercospora kikuchii]GIZ48350.1 hypothetical protein CKM354_001141500 [Cercospora kikuchii]
MTGCGISSQDRNTADKDARYNYKSLCSDCQEFRLLDVQPAEPSETLVKCTLRHANLKDEPVPRYETISYVWGDSQKLGTLVINGKAYIYAASSVEALRRTRYSNAIRTVWIDAVCIDQNNIDERAQQVALMGGLYGHSVGNLVYFGQCEDEHLTHLALQDIGSVLEEMMEETDNLKKIDPSPVKADSGLRCSVDFARLQRCLFSLPWLRRLWIIQEAVLAPSNTCFLGSFQFDLLNLLRAAKWLRHKMLYVPSNFAESAGFENAWTLWDLADVPYGPWTSGQLMVSHLLEKGRGFKASVPVDRVYGMLGLKRWSNEIPRLLQPDYNRPYHEVVRDAMRFALQEYSNGLWLWKHIRITSNESLERSSAPTWVLNLQTVNADIHPMTFAHHHFSCAKAYTQPWAEPGSECGVDPNILEVSGFKLCTVEQMVPELTEEIWADQLRRKHWLKDCIELIEDRGEGLGTATLLIGGVNCNKSLATAQDLAAWTDFKRFVFEDDCQSIDGARMQLAILRPARRYELAMLSQCRRRCVFRTIAGYVGVGSKITARGDIVAMILGGMMPYVLRPTGDGKYRFLGECYIQSDDVMFGEKVAMLQESGAQSEIFRIV